MYFTAALTGSALGFGPAQLLGGLAFPLGLILVVLVCLAHLAGALGTALLIHWSGALPLGQRGGGETAVGIAQAKVALPFAEAFFRGVLYNTLVCLAVWLYFATHTVADKVPRAGSAPLPGRPRAAPDAAGHRSWSSR